MARRWDRALVTGASSGIGEALARRLAGEGTEVVLVARSGDRLHRLAAELPAPAEVLVADLTDRSQVEVVAARVGEGGDRAVDLVVNNAGYGNSADLVDVPADAWLDMVQVNVSAVVHLTHAALDRARRHGGLRTVINVASVAGFAGSAGLGVYSATKSFLITFGQAVHDEAKADGVVVSTLCPGLTRTGFHERARMTGLRVPSLAWQDADEVARTGLDGAARGRALVVPGAVNGAVVTGSRLVPMWAQRRVAGLVRSGR